MKRVVVPVVSIDSYAQSHGLAVVDVIKIDAEGHDSVIIDGAQETLRDRRVKLLFFEYGADLTWAKRRLQPLVAHLDSDFHFDCYFGGELALIKLPETAGNRNTISGTHVQVYLPPVMSELTFTAPRATTPQI